MSTSPTIVLVHGGFADGSGWGPVVQRLLAQGHRVLAPANPLRGLATDAEYVASVLKSIDGPVVLVGHSYGGAVITAAAREADNVAALVYIAAFILDDGESPAAILGRFSGSKIGPDTLDAVPFPGGLDFYIKTEHFADAFAADLPADEVAVMAAVQRPFAAAAFEEALNGPGAWHTIPSWALVATEDYAIPPVAQQFMTKRANAKVVESQGSHAIFASQADKVVDLISDAVESAKS